ncbi:MAG: hypothetical protein ACXVQU_01600 [Actinomycetota bacterium]
MSVTLEDDEPNGLASMLAGLIEANLQRHPSRGALLREAVFDLSAPDAGVAATIETRAGSVRVRNGVHPDGAHISVEASSAELLLLASVPLRGGFPDALTHEGRTVVRHVLAGRIRIRGLLRHPGRLSRLARLLSVV